jgi:hypothetical protein
VLSLDQALAELPDTADGIAAYFIEQECRGKRRHASCCPVANYLTGIGYDDATVSRFDINVWTDDSDIDEMEAATPEQVAEFVERFDQGEWPELIADV